MMLRLFTAGGGNQAPAALFHTVCSDTAYSYFLQRSSAMVYV